VPPTKNLPPHYTIGTTVGPRPQSECQPLDFEPTQSRIRRLFPFPHGTCSLSITGREVRLERGRPLFPRTVLGARYSLLSAGSHRRTGLVSTLYRLLPLLATMEAI
jgi:hypothetical protein